MTVDELYMHRCIELAKLGAGAVAPNPMVGSVLVHNERIIGEGYHQQYGNAHAEVNCINSVKEEDKNLIRHAVLYVSLEPCVHFGKTPPCTDLIIKHTIAKVVVGCIDPYKEVAGKGIDKMKTAGIAVTAGVLEKECIALNKRFLTFQAKQRPYVILKWAQTANRVIGAAGQERLFITNEYANRLVHKWRGEEAAIMIGTNTALLDNPSLTARLWPGKNPIRLVLDMDLQLPAHLNIFDHKASTIIFNRLKGSLDTDNSVSTIKYCKIKENNLEDILTACYRFNIQSILVEGGAKLLQSFINAGLWDEARILTNKKLTIPAGVAAPVLQNEKLTANENIFDDSIEFYTQQNRF